MNPLLLTEDEIVSDVARITGRRARHITQVLKARPGDVLRAGIVRGSLVQAEVLTVSLDLVTLRVEINGAEPPRPPTDLVLAMPRPKALSRTLQAAASFGVGRIDIVNAWRVDKSYFESRRLSPESVETAVWLGCEQGGHTWLPEVGVHRLLMPMLDGFELGDRLGILAHPRAEGGLESVLPMRSARKLVVAIGPEGGWTGQEIQSFAERGFSLVSVGPSVLRVEVAVAAILSNIALLRGHWSR